MVRNLGFGGFDVWDLGLGALQLNTGYVGFRNIVLLK